MNQALYAHMNNKRKMKKKKKQNCPFQTEFKEETEIEREAPEY
jgi:hypothetical protein